MKSFYGVLVVGLLFGSGSLLAEESIATPAQGLAPCMGQGSGPGMWRGYGRGMMHGMTPEQRQQHWAQMQQRGYGPGMGRGMTPEQRQQHWEQMQQRGYGPGMGRGYGRGMMYWMPPAEN